MEEVLNILYEFLFAAPEGVTMALGPLAVAGIASAGIQAVGGIVSGIFGAGRARRARRRAEAEKRRLTGELKSLEKGRQKVINPYSNTKDLSSLAKDLSGKLSNPYANLSVATGASKMQAEEADIALANTLDTLRSSGASAGGATALAQAALQSKKGVAANIEQQEAANEKMRAQGEQYLQQAEISEQRRLQQIQIGEGRRTQQADAAGRSFQFNAQERRKDAEINFTRQQITGQTQRAQQAYDQGTRAVMGGIGAFTGAAAKGVGAGILGSMDPSKFADATEIMKNGVGTGEYQSEMQQTGLLKYLG